MKEKIVRKGLKNVFINGFSSVLFTCELFELSRPIIYLHRIRKLAGNEITFVRSSAAEKPSIPRSDNWDTNR